MVHGGGFARLSPAAEKVPPELPHIPRVRKNPESYRHYRLGLIPYPYFLWQLKNDRPKVVLAGASSPLRTSSAMFLHCEPV